jgi:putative addiction module component (TIGR02574 family)
MASELIESLDPSPLGLDEHWRLELKRRVAAYEAGEAKTFAVEEVFEEIDREFGWK